MTLLLLIDAGNTRVKWALAEEGAPAGQWRADGALTHAELARLPAALRQAAGGAAIARALVSNVAGPALGVQLEALLALPKLNWFASLPALAGLRNGYRQPAQLGCDRFAAAIGARTLEPGKALIVATCGTATTVDALSADGVFIGGMILPGLGLMASSLMRSAFHLPQIDPGAPMPAGFADNTDDAIRSGCLSAQAGAIERASALHGGAPCIISGGAARYVSPLLSVQHRIADNIVLLGLHAAVNISG